MFMYVDKLSMCAEFEDLLPEIAPCSTYKISLTEQTILKTAKQSFVLHPLQIYNQKPELF